MQAPGLHRPTRSTAGNEVALLLARVERVGRKTCPPYPSGGAKLIK
jgi:hypothetical protein